MTDTEEPKIESPKGAVSGGGEEVTYECVVAPKGTVSGGCICGEVTYECVVDAPKVGIVYCHCQDCREAHTAPYTGAFLLPESKVTWKTGMDTMLNYNRRGTNIRKFCSKCGVHGK